MRDLSPRVRTYMTYGTKMFAVVIFAAPDLIRENHESLHHAKVSRYMVYVTRVRKGTHKNQAIPVDREIVAVKNFLSMVLTDKN